MINFRFHLVSLIAVFLALALGVVMGSAVIDRAIVDQLRDRIDQVERNAEERKAENDDLRAELDRVGAYVDAAAAFTVGGRLEDVPVAILAERGTDGSVVKATGQLVRTAGSPTAGLLWMEPLWALGEPEQVKQLAGAIGSSTNTPQRVRKQAWVALAERLAAGSAADAEPVAAGQGESTDVLVRLVDAGFLAVERIGDTDVDLALFPGSEARALYVTSMTSAVDLPDLAALAAGAFMDASVETVVADAFVDEPQAPDRGSELSPVLSDPELSRTVSTVDDLELVEGRVTAVIALQQIAGGVVGHYGYGTGASRSFPAVPER